MCAMDSADSGDVCGCAATFDFRSSNPLLAVSNREPAIGNSEYWLLIADRRSLRRANGSHVAAGRSVEIRQRSHGSDRERLGGEEARFRIVFEVHESGHAGHHGC